MSEKRPQHRNDEGGEEIRDADVRQTEEICPDGKDEDVAGAAEPGGGAVRHIGGEQPRENEDRALKESDGDGGENADLADGCREEHDDGGDVGDDSDTREHRPTPFPFFVMVYSTPFHGGCKMKICDATIRINDGGGAAPHLADPPKGGTLIPVYIQIP